SKRCAPCVNVPNVKSRRVGTAHRGSPPWAVPTLRRRIVMQPGGPPPKISLPGVKHVVAVASGKGGAGKTTVATHLALAFHMLGRRVGLLDADIYGPSIPIMMGIHEVFDPNTAQFPLDKYGLKLMSMGFVVKPETAMIWRGPMVHKYLTAFLTQIPW